MPNKKKFLEPFQQVLADLVKWLKQSVVLGQIIGGVAASLIGRPRFTQDVDALILLEEEKWNGFLKGGKRLGFIPRREDALAFAIKNRVLLIRHLPSGIDVDISIGSLPFERESIRRGVQFKIENLTIPVPTPEDIIIMKAIAHRAKDLVDIGAILEVNTKLDLKRIRKWVREFAKVLDMPEISSDLEKLLRQQQKSLR